jgi:2-phosphosulfolactate phosphatase
VIFDQAGYEVRCEWGLRGVRSLAPGSDAVVIVDVLSFSTAVDIAVARGAEVIPCRWKDAEAERTRRSLTGYSLSPASLESIPQGEALVLPSPNGSTLSLEAAALAATYCACLRNAPAVAAHLRTVARRVAVIPAGERWEDDSLRPGLEDLVGAGAVIAGLPGTLSPEAELALGAFERFRLRLREAIRESGSGRELAERGFGRDIELAAEYGVSQAIPVLDRDRFVAAPSSG